MNHLNVKYLGRLSYEEGLAAQQMIWKQRLAGEISDTLLLLEHDSVFTMGRRDSQHNILVSEEMLAAPLLRCDRGGEITYHGPGQLMGYSHVKLNELNVGQGHKLESPSENKVGIGVKEFVFRLEEALMLLCSEYHLEPWRDSQHRGVWLGQKHISARKIAALGISIKQGVSMHGFALNVCTDLNFFKQIVPCGIADCSVTSLEHELSGGNLSNPNVQVEQVAMQLLKYFCLVFGYEGKFSIKM